MTTSITLPTDPETERLARQVAEMTGKTLPTVVKNAIEAEAAKAGVCTARPFRDDLLARMVEITDRFADIPVLDTRKPDEIIGYDDHGLPQ